MDRPVTLDSLLLVPRHEQEAAELALRDELLSGSSEALLAAHLDTPGALGRAVREGRYRIARLLINNGAVAVYVHLVDALEAGNPAIVQLLLSVVSPALIADELPELLDSASSNLIQLVLADKRLDPALSRYIEFLRAIREHRFNPIASMQWLIDHRVPEAQYACAWILRGTQPVDQLSEYELVYCEYIAVIGYGHVTSNKLTLLLLLANVAE